MRGNDPLCRSQTILRNSFNYLHYCDHHYHTVVITLEDNSPIIFLNCHLHDEHEILALSWSLSSSSTLREHLGNLQRSYEISRHYFLQESHHRLRPPAEALFLVLSKTLRPTALRTLRIKHLQNQGAASNQIWYTYSIPIKRKIIRCRGAYVRGHRPSIKGIRNLLREATSYIRWVSFWSS